MTRAGTKLGIPLGAKLGRAMMAVLCGGGLLLIAACGNGVSPQGAGTTKSIETMSSGNAPRHNDPVKIARGQQVYQAHCAVCHGDHAQGAPNWRQRDADGFYPPPPLNGSGHEWHHSLAALKEIIDNGSPPGQGKMPAWKDQLSVEDVDAVVAWFQSLWPDAVYGEWYAMEQRSFGR